MDTISAQNEEHVAQTIGRKAPRAHQPIPATLVNALGLKLKQFVKHVSGRDFEIDTATSDVHHLPPKLYAMLTGADGFIRSAVKRGLKPFEGYEFDAKDIATDPDAVARAIDLFSRASEDKSLWQAVRAPAGEEKPGEPEEPEAAPEQPVETKAGYEDLI